MLWYLVFETAAGEGEEPHPIAACGTLAGWMGRMKPNGRVEVPRGGVGVTSLGGRVLVGRAKTSSVLRRVGPLDMSYQGITIESAGFLLSASATCCTRVSLILEQRFVRW